MDADDVSGPGLDARGAAGLQDAGRQSAAQAHGERVIADRLDALEAERVLARAIELEQRDGAANMPVDLSVQQLERIAAEVGVDPSFVHQALGELPFIEDDRSRFERFVLPDPLVATETIAGQSRADVEHFVDRYFREFEGLVVETRHVDGVDWNVDRSLVGRLRTRLATGDNAISRVAGNDLAHRVRSVGENEHVVSLRSDGDAPLTVARLGLGLAAFILLAGVVGGLGLGVGWFLQAVAASAVMGGAVAVGAVWGARRWAKGIRRAMHRSMTRLGDLSRRASSAPTRQRRRWGRRPSAN